MLIAIIPLVAAVCGLLVWLLATNPKAAEAGRLLFFCGVFWLVASVSRETLSIGVDR
jgi:hypothetical protein